MEWKNNTIQTTLYFLQKLERRNGKTTQFRQLCTFCKSWRDGMEKQHNSNNFALSAKAGETEWKNNTIQTTLYFVQKLERRNGKTTQFRQLCTFCKSWIDGMEKQHNSNNFALSAKARVRMERDFYFFSQLHTLLDTSKASAMIQTFPLPFHLRTADHTPGKVAGTTPIISSHQNQSESQEHQCVCGCVVGVCMRTCVIHPGICLTV